MKKNKFINCIVKEINLNLKKNNIEKVKKLDELLIIYCNNFTEYKKYFNEIEDKEKYLNYTF